MNAKFAKAVEAAERLPDDQLELLADELARLVEAHAAGAMHRDDETRRGLDDLAAGRVMSMAEFDRRMDAVMEELDGNARAG